MQEYSIIKSDNWCPFFHFHLALHYIFRPEFRITKQKFIKNITKYK